MLDSGFSKFQLDYAGTKHCLGIGDVVYSDVISAGDHLWRLRCYPHGSRQEDHGVYLSVYLQLVSELKNRKVTAIVELFLMDRDGSPSTEYATRRVWAFPPPDSVAWGFQRFVPRRSLESNYVRPDGRVPFVFGVVVLRDVPTGNPVAVPPSDVGDHLGRLLQDSSESDVSFSVAGETFHAHRAVLAARSPVFRTRLLLDVGAAKTSPNCITLHDVEPATFRALLRFVYTDALPPGVEVLGTSSAVEFLQNLLAAADTYHLERLKAVCAHKLWELVSTDNVAAMVSFAELHGCRELRNACIDFFVVEKNFMKAVLTDGYMTLLESSPSVIDEIRKRIGN